MKLYEMIDFRAAPIIPSHGDVRKYLFAKIREMNPVNEDDLIEKATAVLSMPRFQNVPLKVKQHIISDVKDDWVGRYPQ